jgi:DNA-binding CsgD family transcriptional regulator
VADGGGAREIGVWGEPGIGKSRLLGELGARAESRAHVVLAGRATELEREVAGLVAAGHTNAQLALRLQVSEGTVEKHVSNALAKLGMSTLAGIVALLARAG